MEKRNFSRIGFNVGAVLKWQGISFKGEVENLSLHGMFAKTTQKVPAGESVDITIYLTGITPQIPVILEATVVRAEEAGLGLKFKKMNTDSFIHLRNIIAHNTGDDSKVMDELINYISHKQGEE